MKQTAVLLFIMLLLFGCMSAPKKDTEESTQAVSKGETEVKEAEEEKPQTAKKEEEQKIQEKVIPEELALLSKEYSYYADGLLEKYTVFTYKENSAELIKEELYNNLDELIQTISYKFSNELVSMKESYNSEGIIKSYRIYTYNDMNLIESESRFDEQDSIQSASKYEYNNAGNRIKWSIHDGTGALLAYNTYLYQDNANIRIDFFNPSGKLKKYSTIEYDANNNKIKESFYLPNKKLQNYTMYFYKNNLLITESSFEIPEKHTHSVSYEYDQNGNIIRINYSDKNKIIVEMKKREYKLIKIKL